MEQADDIRQSVTDRLVALGWTRTNGTAIARKSYETAVGPKEALAYLQHWPEAMVLAGEYWSEGSNILSTCTARFPLAGDNASLAAQVDAFVAEADRRVRESYAVRLLRPEQDREDRKGPVRQKPSCGM